MKAARFVATMFGVVALIAAATAMSAVPQHLNFQGILLDTGGGVVGDSSYTLTFRIWDDSLFGLQMWAETQVVTTENGLFNTFLGQFVPIPDTTFNGIDRWLEIDLVGFGPYSPRTKFGSVAYAYRVASIEGATGGSVFGDIHLHSTLTIGSLDEAEAGYLNLTNGSSNSIVLDGADRLVGIGLADPSANLHVQGTGIISNSLAVGSGHSVTYDWGFAAGANNIAGDTCASVSGGSGNMAASSMSSVGGGIDNTALAYAATVGGGRNNNASNSYAAITGGQSNTANAVFASVAGGYSNTASGRYATAAGGQLNFATGYSGITVGGYDNEAGDTTALAAGFRAKALHTGSFVWADRTNFDFSSSTRNEFSVRSTGGARFISAVNIFGIPSAGVLLAAGSGSWSSLSDRDAKESLSPVDGAELLERLASVPITTWKYKSQDERIRHIGPMAQDFHAAFGVGEDERHITSIDADGVALAAIQELYRQSQERETELRRRIEQLEQIVNQLTTHTQQ